MKKNPEPFMISALNNVETEGNFLSMTKDMGEKLTFMSQSAVKDGKFSPTIRDKSRMPTFTASFQCRNGSLARAVRHTQINKIKNQDINPYNCLGTWISRSFKDARTVSSTRGAGKRARVPLEPYLTPHRGGTSRWIND